VGRVSGDLYVSGGVHGGSIDLATVGGTTLTLTDTSFLARLDHNTGNVVWLAETGAGIIRTDAAEKVYLSGSGGYTYIYGQGTGGVPASGSGPYFAKLDSNGNAVWWDQIDLGWYGHGAPRLDVDAGGSLYVIGSFTGTVDLDPGTTVRNVKPTGWSDLYVEKIDTNGHLVWVRTYGAKFTNTYGGSIAVDVNGNVDATASGNSGGAYNTATGWGFHMGSGKTLVSGTFAQFDNNGNMKWLSSQVGGTILDPAGNMYGGGLTKWSPSGALIWSAPNGGADAINAAGDIYFGRAGGYPSGQVNVSPTATPIYLAASSTWDSFELVKWTQPGGFAAAQGAGTTQAFSSSLAVTPSTSPSVPSHAPLFVGDTPPGISIPLVPVPDSAPLELWIGKKRLRMAV
jgi:hypothetical protein